MQKKLTNWKLPKYVEYTEKECKYNKQNFLVNMSPTESSDGGSKSKHGGGKNPIN